MKQIDTDLITSLFCVYVCWKCMVNNSMNGFDHQGIDHFILAEKSFFSLFAVKKHFISNFSAEFYDELIWLS